MMTMMMMINLIWQVRWRDPEIITGQLDESQEVDADGIAKAFNLP